MYNAHPLLATKMSGKPSFGAAGLTLHTPSVYDSPIRILLLRSAKRSKAVYHNL